MIRFAAIFCFVAMPALAAEPTFTKEEVQAAYELGAADAIRGQVAAKPAARSMTEKMKPQTTDAAVKK